MRIEIATADYVAGLTAVSALVGTRVYGLRLPETPTYPCVLVTLRHEPTGYTHDGPNELQFAELQVDSFATESSGQDFYADVSALADAVDAGLSGYVGPMGDSSPQPIDVRAILRTNRVPTYDPDERRVVRMIQEYTVWYRPATA